MPHTDLLTTHMTPNKSANYSAIYILFVIILGFLLYCLYYEFNIGSRVIESEYPFLEAIEEIQYKTTHVRLLLEKAANGSQDIDLVQVIDHLNECQRYLKAILAQPHEKAGISHLLEQSDLGVKGSYIIDNIHNYIDSIEKLKGIFLKSGINPKNIDQYDHFYNAFLPQTEQIESYTDTLIRENFNYYKMVKNILFLTYIGLSMLLVLTFLFFERKKHMDFLKIEEAKEMAEAKEQWLRVTMRSMGDGLITTDTAANVTYINPVASSLTGWNSDEAVGKNIHDVFNIVNEKTRNPVVNPVKEVLKRKYVVGLANHTVLISKGGAEYPIADSGAPIIDQNGDCIGTVLVFHDVTERVKAENQLRNARKEWERSFNAIKDIITIMDKDMRITKANTAACTLFNAKEEDLIGRYCYELFNGTNTPCPQCPIVEGHQNILKLETILKHTRFGKTFQVSISPIFDEKFELEYFVHTAKDITESIKLERDLLQARKMEAIGTLAGGIAHDFNNILTGILGYTELALEMVKSKGNSKVLVEYLNNVDSAGKRAKDLVKQILTFSRKSKHDQYGPLFPHLIVKESLKLIRAILPTSINLQTEIATSGGAIMADPTKIQQIVMNLCTNAADAMEHDIGTLKVKLANVYLTEKQTSGIEGVVPGPYIEISVSDTGVGIDDETMKHIFEPYFTTKKIGKGTGMGLAMVHGIIQDYHGMIKVESEIGTGTTVLVYLPVMESQALETETEPEQSLNGNERILVIDDEAFIVGLHKMSLESLGYKVTGMTSSMAALELFKKAPENFDIIVTDQSMPEMTGKELTKRILEIQPDMPIILNTGFSSMISEQEAKSIGIREFVMKPVDRRTLARLIRKAIDNK